MNTQLNVSEMIEGFVSDSIFDEIKTLHKENKTLIEIIEDLPDYSNYSITCKQTIASVKSKNEKRIEDLYRQLHKNGVFVKEQLTSNSN